MDQGPNGIALGELFERLYDEPGIVMHPKTVIVSEMFNTMSLCTY